VGAAEAAAAAAVAAAAAAAVGAADSVALRMGKRWLVQRWSLKASWFVTRVSLNYEKLAETVQPGVHLAMTHVTAVSRISWALQLNTKRVQFSQIQQTRHFCELAAIRQMKLSWQHTAVQPPLFCKHAYESVTTRHVTMILLAMASAAAALATAPPPTCSATEPLCLRGGGTGTLRRYTTPRTRRRPPPPRAAPQRWPVRDEYIPLLRSTNSH
jgi:hypothetical protein